MESHRSQGNDMAGFLRTSTGDLAFFLQGGHMDAIVKVLESAGASCNPPLKPLTRPSVTFLTLMQQTKRINESTHLAGQEKICVRDR